MGTTILDKGPEARRWILLAMVLVVPLAFSRGFYQTYSVPKLGLLMIGVALVGGIRFIEFLQGSSAQGLKRLWVPAAAFIGPLSVAWFFAPYRIWSLFGQLGRFQGLVPYIVIVLLGILIADAFSGQAERLAQALILSAALMGAYHVLQFLGLDPFPLASEDLPNRQARGTMGNTNFAGGFLAIALPVAAAHLLSNERERERTATALIFITAGLIVTFSQGAYAGATAGLAVAGGIVLISRWPLARWAGLAIAGLVAVAAVGSILASIVKPGHPTIPLTIQDRGRFWEQAGGMFADSPLIGRGPNAFAVEGVQYKPARDATAAAFIEVADDPHSVPLAMATSAGILGAAGYLLAMGWVLRKGLEIEEENLLAAGFFGGAIAYFIQSLASIDEVGLRVGFWIVLGGMIASTAAKHRPPSATKGKRKKTAPLPQPLRQPVAVAVVAILALTGTAWAGRFMWADVQVRQGVEFFVNIEPFKGQEALQSALGFRADNEYRNLYGFQAGQTALDGGKEAGFPFAEERDNAYSYLEDFPDVPALRDYAILLELWEPADPDADDRAAQLYLRAVALDPVRPGLTDEAAVLLLSLGRTDETERILRTHLAAIHPGETVEPLLASKWGQLALTFVQQQKSEPAQVAIQRALALDPSQPEALQARESLEAAEEAAG